MESLASKILTVLSRNPERIVFSGANVNLRGSEVLANMEAIRRRLEDNSLPGERVALSLPNSVELATALLAVLCSNRTPLLADRPIVRSPAEPPSLSSVPEVILMTSGTSGSPKAVRHSHAALNFVFEKIIERFSLNEKSVTALTLPMTHTFALNTQFFPTFLAGGRCFFADSVLGLAKTYSAILQSKASFIGLLGSLLGQLQIERERYDLPLATEVSHLQLAGDFTSVTQWRQARALFPCAEIHVGYGSTETLRVAMAHLADADFVYGYAGEPLPGISLEIRDGQSQPLKDGVTGDIFVRGPNVMLGYDSEPALASGSFIATGDQGFVNRGRLFITGRKDRLFKVNGLFVSPSEWEKRTGALPGVQRCVCLPYEIRSGEKTPLLFVELEQWAEDGSSLSNQVREIANCLRKDQLSAHVILNPKWVFTVSGKIDGPAMVNQAAPILDAEPFILTGGCRFWKKGSLPSAP